MKTLNTRIARQRQAERTAILSLGELGRVIAGKDGLAFQAVEAALKAAR